MQPPPAAPPPIEPAPSPLAGFLTARFELARLEARLAAREAARKGALAAGLVVAAGFAWGLMLAGGLGWAASGGLPWHWLAIGLGLLHLLGAIVLGIVLTLPSAPVFPHTREELAKDREWLENLKRTLKSSD